MPVLRFEMILSFLPLIPVMPFTGQFARPSYWASPTFKEDQPRAQRRLGAAIFASGVSRVVAAAAERSGATAWPAC